MKKIAIIGRPNVGKSTLFNRFAGRRMALVHPQPGMTRDRRETEGKLYDLKFKIIDTAGLADPDDSELTQAMFAQTKRAIDEADVILFVIDAREGCTPYDNELADLVRRQHKPVIVIANKCEGHNGDAGFAEATGLGLGDVVAMSAEHGLGLGDLYEFMMPLFEDESSDFEDEEDDFVEEEILTSREADQSENEDEDEEESEVDEGKPLQLAIIGRPNVGKSTLINKFLGEDRLLVADMPGVTRDAITLDWVYEGRKISLIDTAGIRRRSKVDNSAERLAVMDSDRQIQYAEVVILVIDSTQPFEKQDLTIAYDILQEGRALVIALNKWDLVQDKKAFMKKVEDALEHQLTQARGIPCVTICARDGKNLHSLMDAVFQIYRTWNRRISTGQLNKWLSFVTENHPAPVVKGRRIRLKYMSQIKTRPPTFAVFASQAEELPDSYSRYLVNNLRKDFKLDGVPIRIFVRGSKNPFHEKK